MLPSESGPAEAGDTVWPEPPCTPGADTDSDMIPDEIEGCGPPPVNTDGDRYSDFNDPDSDNDKIPDLIEGTTCSDDDDLPDFQDTDSDNDGVQDGDEDFNGDGMIGCCLQRCGEQRDGCPTVPADGCGPGQTCAVDVCQPAAAFLCSEGETDPRQAETFSGNDKDLPSFICRSGEKEKDQGLKVIDYQRSSQGDWTIALEQGTPYSEVAIPSPGPLSAAATFDLRGANQAVAGFILSQEAPPGQIAALAAQVSSSIASNLTGLVALTQISSGTMTTSHDTFPVVVSTQVAITTQNSQRPGALRNALVGALLGQQPTSGGAEDYGPSGTSFLLRFQTLLRGNRLLIMGGLAPAPMAEDLSRETGHLLDDLSNGTGLATAADSGTVECDPFIVEQVASADLIWIVDESTSMKNNRDNIVKNAADFFARAQSSGLDFRMAVAGVADPVDDNPYKPPVVVGKLCGKMMAAPSEAIDNDDGGPDRFLQPTEQAIFESCVANPPYDEKFSEYGLAHAYDAVVRHLPRQDGVEDKIRTKATLVIIIVSDEVSRELMAGGQWQGKSGFLQSTEYSPENLPQSCTLSASSQLKVNSYLKPWLDLYTGQDPTWQEQGKAIVNLIGGLCTSTCQPDVAHGYFELVNATGGITADVCQQNLGATLQVIIDSIIGVASPTVLQYVPISASVAVAIDQTPLQRSRVQGFDYIGASNSLVFAGVPLTQGSQIVASYRRWVQQAVIE